MIEVTIIIIKLDVKATWYELSINLDANSVVDTKLTSIDPTNNVTPYPNATPQNAAIIPAIGLRLFLWNVIAASGIKIT